MSITRTDASVPYIPQASSPQKRKIDEVEGEKPRERTDKKMRTLSTSAVPTMARVLMRSNSVDAGPSQTPPFALHEEKNGLVLHLSESLPVEIQEEFVLDNSFENLSTSNQKYFENTKQAMRDHGLDPGTIPQPILNPTPVKIIFDKCEKIGLRADLEDASDVWEKEGVGQAFFVFDGHAEKGKTAHFALERSVSALNKMEIDDERLEHMGSAFFEPLHEQIHKNVPQRHGGTTALECFLKADGTNHLITSTLGDSEAAVLRWIDGVLKIFYLSPKVNWSSPEFEKAFLEIYADQPDLCAQFLASPPKHRRFPFPKGINIPETIGDLTCHYKGKSILKHVPHISLFQVLEGDIVVALCDGGWDMLLDKEGIVDRKKEQAFLDFIVQNIHATNIAEKIVDYFLKLGSTDNVSAVFGRVVEKGQEDEKVIEMTPSTEEFT